jgi:hypothetical protein
VLLGESVPIPFANNAAPRKATVWPEVVAFWWDIEVEMRALPHPAVVSAVSLEADGATVPVMRTAIDCSDRIP